MKLSIIKPDGAIVDIIMNEDQPSLDRLYNDTLFFENYQYKLSVREYENCNNLELYVGDYSIPIHYNIATDCYETDRILLFNGCFDLSYLCVVIDIINNSEKVYYSEYLRIATTKQTTLQVEQMLNEIEMYLPNYLDVCFSRNKKRAGLIHNEIRSIWNTLKIIDEVINVYEQNIGLFSNQKKAFIEEVPSIVDIKDMRHVGYDSLRWITCNPEYLVATEIETGIHYKNQQYLPSKIKTNQSKYSYEVYENQIILGFLKNLLDYLDNQIEDLTNEMISLDIIPEVIIVQLPNTHELTGRCIYIYYKGIVEKLRIRREVLQELFYKYECILECSATKVYGIPKLTNTFKQVFHYRSCYECIVKWFETGDYSLDHLNYLFGLKTLSRIFEYYCLIKMQIALKQLGYTLLKAEHIVYNQEEEKEDINNQYIFYGNGYNITLLYEPAICVNQNNASFNLYSTGYNFIKSKWNDRWTPDFILKITSDISEYYFIIDAKYSNLQNVKKFYMPSLVLKYGTQIASKDKFFSDIIGIGAIYPSDQDTFFNFKKNRVGSSKESLPMLFACSILGGENGNEKIRKHFQLLIDVVDAIEKNSTRMVINSEDSFLYMDNKITLQSEFEKVQIPIIDERNNKEKNSINHSFQNECDKLDVKPGISMKSEKKMVNGRKCFYNAKNMCLRQKKRCDIMDEPCELFVSKSSRELLKEEVLCRNFMVNKKKGKVNRVECRAFGMLGCIGSDECKFCLKKNKHK